MSYARSGSSYPSDKSIRELLEEAAEKQKENQKILIFHHY